ncbi:50S ribosomal protein L3 N(5)-glutamine methyltransferase [Laribacter hongkongensis]|uniref:Ribosomal protein uL3 glutamine methyltransferase n=1 Tax=Laribacter hongkongensis TaxID=168471 RepID=A0A248LFT3_9NEIS|nr:50S ribosomal protein L3 N(5)-glutamine methyltransferase [Laribacter hongkongensis]ASJ23617.1 50S ribosomal protein L3 glutamine methyltransferase [Laribacter hongkongensis]MCG9039566.1 50S ribosomal protein L3 N(5)-glutamine methyltransferase [Laribacter hongkongensis]MCG9068514.1 50S ribosomal protein L3 N(5)-glutamine methyltransferase [Laribacter hongkongensis]MCG9090392.1 50S ribosomal protein L3 N(5)-glutamine methyltransferase [Laribacter hongkongensis]MCG9109300.1 50S ribosomal pro
MYAEARHTLHTVRDVLRFAISRFQEAGLVFGHGSDNAWDEAAYLLAHSLHLPLERFDALLDCRLLPTERDAALAVIERRVSERLPAAYLTHEAWLAGHDFYVDERVIVPRSFIAELLPEALEPWIEHPELVHSALDLCTGSGCLAILTALYYPDADVDAIDLSPEALEVAGINVGRYGMQDRIRLVESDLWVGVAGLSYDLIVSNPPYVDAESVAALPDEYLKEPELALGSGDDGLEATRRILEEAAAHLNPLGVLVVEIGHNRDVLEMQYPQLPFTWLETSGGDGFVFLLTREELVEAGFGD